MRLEMLQEAHNDSQVHTLGLYAFKNPSVWWLGSDDISHSLSIIINYQLPVSA